jgi:2-methylisocitrate lyase-like PEP mutase family enzyme
MSTQLEKAERFRALHEREGAFVIPNPWDVGSARLLSALGFDALATTSSGLANALGRSDGAVDFGELLEHCRALSAATDLPISADIENGFAEEPARAASNILEVARAGAVGGSIEDYSGDESRPIYDFALAVERVEAASEATRTLDFPFFLTARAENLIRGRNDLDDTIRRLQAFEKAGADVLYAPGLRTLSEVRDVVSSVGRPVNVLAPVLKGVTVAELAQAGVRRISVGGALARSATGALLRAAREMAERGSFSWTAELPSGAEVERLLGNGTDR